MRYECSSRLLNTFPRESLQPPFCAPHVCQLTSAAVAFLPIVQFCALQKGAWQSIHAKARHPTTGFAGFFSRF
jgi:hypothetical protein